MYFVSDDAYYLIWAVDAETGAAVQGLSAPDDAILGVSPPPSSGLAFAAGELYYTHDATPLLWVLDAESGDVVRSFEKPATDISGLTFAHGVLYAAAEIDSQGTLYGLDPITGVVQSTLAVPRASGALAASEARGSVFVRVGALEVREISAANGDVLGSIVPPVPTTGLAVSEDEARQSLLFLNASGELTTYDLLAGTTTDPMELVETAGNRLVRTGGLATGTLPPPTEGGEGGGVPVSGAAIEVQDTNVRADRTASVPILMTNDQALQGYVIAAVHDPAVLTLEDVSFAGTETEANFAEFVAAELLPNGATIGVIFDVDAPFENNVLPPGVDQVVARLAYSCVNRDPTEETSTEVRLVDGVIGQPAKDNLIVVDGVTSTPELFPGTILCVLPPPPSTEPQFLCGGPPAADGLPTPLTAGRGETDTLCFFYAFPSDRPAGIQGLSMALAYDCRLDCLEETFGLVPGGIADVIGTEFVEFQCDEDPTDGDGCEMILAMLLDSSPPFDGQTLPPTSMPFPLACVDLRVTPEATVGECLDVRFQDGVNGENKVPTKNLVSVKNEAIAALTSSCEVCVVPSGPTLFCGSGALDVHGLPGPLVGENGDEVELFFWYRSPVEEVFSLTQAVRIDCRAACIADTFLADPGLQGVVNRGDLSLECDSDPADGDGCEIVLRFERTAGNPSLPATDLPVRLGRVRLRIGENIARGKCLPIEHHDQIDGEGTEIVDNQVITPSGILSPETVDCEICVRPAPLPRFFCGGPNLDPETGLPEIPSEVRLGESVEFSLWYSSPDDELDITDQIQGLSMAIQYDCNLICQEDTFTIPPDSALELVDAEFVSFECENDPTDGDGCEMLFAVLVDLNPPFDGRTLPQSDTPLKLASVTMQVGPGAVLGTCLPVRFLDGVDGKGIVPNKNIVSLNNEGVSPETFDCEVCVRPLGPTFFCGPEDFAPDGIIDPAPGDAVPLCFFYSSPTDELFTAIQGFSMGLTFDCRLTCLPDTFRLPEDSILLALGADFVDFQCDNDPDDGDGCEMIFGVLMDATPPFDGQTLPPTDIPLKLACVDMVIPTDAVCFECFDVNFEDGVNGNNKVPIKNQIAVDNMAFFARTQDCEICVDMIVEEKTFVRGDCNGSAGSEEEPVNIADAASVVSLLFGLDELKPEPVCLDACDANDDGRLELTDTLAILLFLFNDGTPPPPPGPHTAGFDPTKDVIPCGDRLCPTDGDDETADGASGEGSPTG